MKKLTAILLALLILVALTACGKAAKNEINDSSMSNEMAPGYTGGPIDEESKDKAPSSPEETGTISGIDSVNDLEYRKIIKEASLSAKTEDFDGFISGLREKTTADGGFVQSYSSNGTDGKRRATLELRIPADKFDAFIASISEKASVANYQESIQDVTMQYADTESRIKALRTEQDTLLGILETAKDLDSVIKLQDRLSDIRAEIESYESQKRVYDSLISYSTLTVYTQEVERIPSASGEKQSVWQEIGSSLSDNLYQIGQGFRAFFIWFTGNLPYFILIAIFAAAVIFIVRATIKHNKKKKQNTKENKGESQS